MSMPDRPEPSLSGPLTWSGLAIGFGLGGFFDGILLHQILQWHHLLSAVEAASRDLPLLIMTDGLFHLAMYVVTAVGLWLLYRSRHAFARPGADRWLAAHALIGFGLWHVVDAILSHWLLGIHRIRMDTDNPLLWDLLWLVVFGLVPLAIGWMLRRPPRQGSVAFSCSPVALVVATLLAAPMSAAPPPETDAVVVLFRPGTEPTAALAAIIGTGARVAWTDRTQQVWAITDAPDDVAARLVSSGALFVSRSMLPAGCLDWTGPQPS